MASELRVDTLKDSSGSNSVGMAYVAGGSAKAWVNHSGSTTVRDSFNVASNTDNGTGDYTTNYSNAMGNGDYTMSGSTEGTNASNNGNLGVKDDNAALTTSGVRHVVINNSNTIVDRDPVLVIIHGDLA